MIVLQPGRPPCSHDLETSLVIYVWQQHYCTTCICSNLAWDMSEHYGGKTPCNYQRQHIQRSKRVEFLLPSKYFRVHALTVKINKLNNERVIIDSNFTFAHYKCIELAKYMGRKVLNWDIFWVLAIIFLTSQFDIATISRYFRYFNRFYAMFTQLHDS